MPDCQRIDALVTPYIDDQLTPADREAVERHVRACPPCYSRVEAERAVHELIHTRRTELSTVCASNMLHMRCAKLARAEAEAAAPAAAGSVGRPRWRASVGSLAVAASLVLVAGGAFVYQMTATSSHVMAAELAADHIKCFALNDVLHTHDAPADVERAMLAGFNWSSAPAQTAGLDLVGSRPCVYGEGKIAHIMYRHNGEPVSLFMLPGTSRDSEVVRTLGHEAAIWCDGKRTYVLVAREPKESVAQMASLVRASMR